jgi:hypothetical protein
MRRVVVGVAVGLAPALASACATCARDQGSGAVLLLVGAMIVAPYVVAAVVIRAVRAAGGEP